MERCFVIMPIGSGNQAAKWQVIYHEIFKPSVEGSGLGLECERADEICQSGSIMKQVLFRLHTSRIVLADLSSQNANVFYELGVRHSTRKRTILVGQSPTDSPFDTQQYRMLVYKYPIDRSDDFHGNIREFLEHALRNSDELDNPVADLFQYTAMPLNQVMVRGILDELEVNLGIVQKFQSGHAYLSPLVTEWLQHRSGLAWMPSEVRDELAGAYRKVQRWKAIADKPIHPSLGNMEIPQICGELKTELPRLIEELKTLLAKP